LRSKKVIGGSLTAALLALAGFYALLNPLVPVVPDEGCLIGANHNHPYGFWEAAYSPQIPRPKACVTREEFSALGLKATRVHFPWGAFDAEAESLGLGPSFVQKFLDYVYPEDVDIVLGIRMQHPNKTKNPGRYGIRHPHDVYPAKDINQFYDDVKAFAEVILKDARIKYIQIGNEPGINWEGTVEEWAGQVKAAARAIRAVDPDIPILTGGSVNIEWVTKPESPYYKAIKILFPEPGKPAVPGMMIDMHYYGKCERGGITLANYVDSVLNPFFDSLGVDWTITETNALLQAGWDRRIYEMFKECRLSGFTCAEILDSARVLERKYNPGSLMLPENRAVRESLLVEDVHTRVEAFAAAKRCRMVLWWGIWGHQDSLHAHWYKPFEPRPDTAAALAADWKTVNSHYRLGMQYLFVDGRKLLLADSLKVIADRYYAKE
jgi:hypothetical protein